MATKPLSWPKFHWQVMHGRVWSFFLGIKLPSMGLTCLWGQRPHVSLETQSEDKSSRRRRRVFFRSAEERDDFVSNFSVYWYRNCEPAGLTCILQQSNKYLIILTYLTYAYTPSNLVSFRAGVKQVLPENEIADLLITHHHVNPLMHIIFSGIRRHLSRFSENILCYALHTSTVFPSITAEPIHPSITQCRHEALSAKAGDKGKQLKISR